MCGPRVARGHRAAARLGLESELGARSGIGPTGGSRLVPKEEGERREGAGWAAGPGRKMVGWAVQGGKKGRGGVGPAGPHRRREEKGGAGLGQEEKRRKRERKNCIRMHLNLNLKFKFKWKTSNKIMQCGIKCTRSIFPYISFCS
jgi:hypothetical protein